MKKTLSLLLVFAMLLSGLALLASCAHKCTFSTQLSYDEDKHWYACEKTDCPEVSNKASHDWTEGEITTKPTQEAAGVKTYTCTACAQTKTEEVAFTGLTKNDWNAAINSELFDNYTLSMTIASLNTGVSVISTLLYKFTADKIYISMTASTGQEMEQIIDENVAEEKEEMAEELVAMFDYADFTYDAEAKLYRAKGEIKVVFDQSMPTDATLRFENGKPVEMKYSYIEEVSGVTLETTIVFSDYGTTVISDAQ